MTDQELSEEKARAALCESVTIPGDQWRAILDEIERWKKMEEIAKRFVMSLMDRQMGHFQGEFRDLLEEPE